MHFSIVFLSLLTFTLGCPAGAPSGYSQRPNTVTLSGQPGETSTTAAQTTYWTTSTEQPIETLTSYSTSNSPVTPTVVSTEQSSAETTPEFPVTFTIFPTDTKQSTVETISEPPVTFTILPTDTVETTSELPVTFTIFPTDTEQPTVVTTSEPPVTPTILPTDTDQPTVVTLVLTGKPSGGCNANNCARAVTGTRNRDPDVSSRRADCSSFMTTMVTPATVLTTTTITSTFTVRLPVKRHIDGRQVTATPIGVPSYASACANEAAFASACSCWGITATTTTAPTPTQTITEYATVTVGPGCSNPGNCDAGDSFDIVACPGIEAGSCSCGTDVSGINFCFAIPSIQCGVPRCFTNGDCVQPSRCLVHSCCIDLQPGQGVCVPPADNVCANPDVALRVIARAWAKDRTLRRGQGCGVVTKC